MVRDLSEDRNFGESVARKVEERNIINHLMATRALLGLSQKEIADKMGCTQSRISKLESGKDDDLRIGDFHSYAEALGFQLVIFIGKKGKPPIADRIKYHTSALKKLIAELASLVGADATMRKGAWKLLLDSTRNLALGIANLVTEIAHSLPQAHSDKPSPIQVEVQEDEPEDLPDGDDVTEGADRGAPVLS